VTGLYAATAGIGEGIGKNLDGGIAWIIDKEANNAIIASCDVTVKFLVLHSETDEILMVQPMVCQEAALWQVLLHYLLHLYNLVLF
jgi:hypothetical protein